MIKLLFQIDHSQGQRALAYIWVAVYEHVIVRTIFLVILVPDCTWNHCISYFSGKWVSHLFTKLTIFFRDVMYHLKSSVIEGLDCVLEQGSLTPLFLKAQWALNLIHELVVV